MDISSEQFNGLNWNISKILKGKSTQIPQGKLIYKTIQGDYNLRFSNYTNTNLVIESDSEITDGQI